MLIIYHNEIKLSVCKNIFCCLLQKSEIVTSISAVSFCYVYFCVISQNILWNRNWFPTYNSIWFNIWSSLKVWPDFIYNFTAIFLFLFGKFKTHSHFGPLFIWQYYLFLYFFVTDQLTKNLALYLTSPIRLCKDSVNDWGYQYFKDVCKLTEVWL